MDYPTYADIITKYDQAMERVSKIGGEEVHITWAAEKMYVLIISVEIGVTQKRKSREKQIKWRKSRSGGMRPDCGCLCCGTN